MMKETNLQFQVIGMVLYALSCLQDVVDDSTLV